MHLLTRALSIRLNGTEVMGYIGSVLVLVSFLMTSVVKLRRVNMAGSLISCTYSLIIGSYPLALMNCALVLINLHFLLKARGTSEKHYTLLETGRDDAVLRHLLHKYGEDIAACFPGLSVDPDSADDAFVTLCDDATAGIVLGRREGDTLRLFLDYSLPPYRDHSLGRFLLEAFPGRGIRTLIYTGPAENHLTHLEKMGYEALPDGSWMRKL